MDKNYVRRFWENNSGLENIYWTIDNVREPDSMRCFRHLKDAKDHLENMNGMNGRSTPTIPIAIGTITREQYLKEFAVDETLNIVEPVNEPVHLAQMIAPLPLVHFPTETCKQESESNKIGSDKVNEIRKINLTSGSDNTSITTKTITKTITQTKTITKSSSQTTTVTTTETITTTPKKVTTVTTTTTKTVNIINEKSLPVIVTPDEKSQPCISDIPDTSTLRHDAPVPPISAGDINLPAPFIEQGLGIREIPISTTEIYNNTMFSSDRPPV